MLRSEAEWLQQQDRRDHAEADATVLGGVPKPVYPLSPVGSEARDDSTP